MDFILKNKTVLSYFCTPLWRDQVALSVGQRPCDKNPSRQIGTGLVEHAIPPEVDIEVLGRHPMEAEHPFLEAAVVGVGVVD
jgi:hypothetical protein